ncbi:molybdenum cofactor guanylyltransferase [Halorubrum sp. AD140]|uniref:molybdenum cofactor guanylyltransferase n=1 Tax=Halorubrum sp. AD140 TaxID=3050073 RepID=UPI002ACCCB3C|nr:molybdenum cofactor guanylyltransferase [Halorubrum sp. AD140]MDZ5812907.1 molybdenum cofactor guanylyltransferase [Halorubrum sp. AD140]
MTTGAIVAGGRSTRFGDRDKSVAELADTPMIRRVANRLAGTDDPVPPGATRAASGDPVVDDLVINCRPDQRDAIAAALDGVALPVRWALDDEPDLGPVAGIRNACRAAPSEYAVVVACDMPFVDPAFVATLREDAAGHEAAVPQLDDRWLQTTQAVYRAEAMATACDRALARGDRKVLAPLEELDGVIVGDETIRLRTTARTFTNVNTREELAEAEAAIAAALGEVGGGTDGGDADAGDARAGRDRR